MASADAGTALETEYQVFLSFRGPDTRTGFTDILFHSLIDHGICVFRDDEELPVGERIEGSLEQAMDNSKIYIPILSQTYASSKWCLRELEQIMANTSKSEGDKEILPIFFDMELEDVKLKTTLYTNAILRLQSEKKLSNEQIDAWREVLKEVGAIKGWEVKKYRGHGELIKLVTEKVVEKLKRKDKLVTEHLVGIDDHVVAINELLDINSGDVRAKSSRIDGLIELQKKLLSEIAVHAGTKSIDEIDYGMQRIGEALSNKKVFIVIDDVDKSEHVEKLLGKRTLRSRSRILITTRNKDVLQIHRSKYHILDFEMQVMSTNCALELLSRHAFNNDSPLDDYDDLSREIVSATGRLPLALEVIGSFLYEKGQQIWQETSEKLSKAPHKDVFGKLKISYDALTLEQEQIFLDIACFFIDEDKTNPIYMWKSCEFSADTGLHVLIDMSLVKIGENNK
ncbi:TMV resistance protein N-like [Eucalyptus grandis]|uniref:TMV resistance protein N-like n=1 Tax=Eucalyptus grandis TaxID=71139 RepID=UPI00192EE1A6|nr:TMV resistance protein N-like [Eucalyptus grandis]